MFRLTHTLQMAVVKDIRRSALQYTGALVLVVMVTLVTQELHFTRYQSQIFVKEMSSLNNPNRHIHTVTDYYFNLTCLKEDVNMISETKAKVEQLMQSPVINDFKMRFTVSLAHKCADFIPEVIIIVPSSRGNFQNRKNVREGNQGIYTKLNNNSVLLLFFIGNGPRWEKPNITNILSDEMKQHGDIVQADFEDIYRNVLLKHIEMMKWIQTYCQGARFILRTDDDVGVDMNQLVQSMRRHGSEREHFILGLIKEGDRVHREGYWKWVVPIEDYAPAIWPRFVHGGAIGYPTSTVKLLYEAARRIKTVWLDDVFITGVCASALGIPRCEDKSFGFLHE